MAASRATPGKPGRGVVAATSAGTATPSKRGPSGVDGSPTGNSSPTRSATARRNRPLRQRPAATSKRALGLAIS
eukprot:8627323-Pyramimonas_sp.AAC.1